MPCCGSARTSRGHLAMLREEAADPALRRTVSFSYLGSATLNVVGGATGRQYRFQGYGATLAVDASDAIGISAVPLLRRSA